MDSIFEAAKEFQARCADLDNMELEAVEDFLGSMQDVFLNLLGAEPKKSMKAEHRRWKEMLKELHSSINKAEKREELLFEQRHPKLRYYCQLIEQDHSEMDWVKLKREIDSWLSGSAPETAEEFERLGYKEMLDACCEGLSFDEEAEPPAELWKYSPIPCFTKYLPLIYAVDELWDSFQLYVRSEFSGHGEEFFAFHRSSEAMAIWFRAIEKEGDGIPISIFASAAYLLLRYKDLGHDLDKELAGLGSRSSAQTH